MPEDISAQIAEVKQRLDRWHRLRDSLPRARERLSEEAYRLRRVDNSLDEVRQQVDALESFTLEGLVGALFGSKERKLGEHREELAGLERQHDEGEGMLHTLEQEVGEIEDEVARLGGIEGEYQSLCDRKREIILASGNESADRLDALSVQLAEAKADRHELEKAIQIGKNLLERLHNMTNALGRARNRIFYGGPLGIVGNIAFNAVTRPGTEVMIQRVRDGLAEFGLCIEELRLGRTETDREIARLGAGVTEFCHELSGNWQGKLTCDMSVTLPILEHVQNTIGHLRGKLENLGPRIAALDEQQRLLIEST